MQLELNRRSKVPMYRQLAAELREQIVSGAMAEATACLPNASCPHVSKSIAPRCCRRISSSRTKVLSPPKSAKARSCCRLPPRAEHRTRQTVTSGMQ